MPFKLQLVFCDLGQTSQLISPRTMSPTAVGRMVRVWFLGYCVSVSLVMCCADTVESALSSSSGGSAV